LGEIGRGERSKGRIKELDRRRLKQEERNP